ncbi:MAG: glycosyltransferase family 39 protein [Clostridiales bacterium]|jgi:hypothetical protein|nr:glycosyltransferase family 39 protein [Clostridiales bacterium]
MKKRIIIALSIVFLALAVFSIINYGPFATLDELELYNNDDSKYLRAAETLINTGTLTYNNPSEPTVFIMPGIIFLLTPFVALFGQNGAVLAFKIFQALLQMLNLWLVWLIAKRCFDKKIAILAVIISIFYIADFYAMNTVLTEVVFKTLVISMIFFTIKAFEAPGIKSYIPAGIFWAVAILFRPTILLFPIVVLIIWIVKRYRFTDILKYSFLVLSIAVLFLSGWWIRNYIQFDKFIPLTLSTGNPMLQGTYIDYQKDESEEMILDYTQVHLPNLEGLPSEIVDNIRETEIAKYRLKQLFPLKPVQFISWYTIGKTAYQWSMPFVWRPIMNVPLTLIYAQHSIIITFFLIGLMLALFDKQRNYKWLFLFLTILYFNCIHLPFYAFSRYIFPCMPLVIIFAAYGIFRVIRLVRNAAASKKISQIKKI